MVITFQRVENKNLNMHISNFNDAQPSCKNIVKLWDILKTLITQTHCI